MNENWLKKFPGIAIMLYLPVVYLTDLLEKRNNLALANNHPIEYRNIFTAFKKTLNFFGREKGMEVLDAIPIVIQNWINKRIQSIDPLMVGKKLPTDNEIILFRPQFVKYVL